jgi:hypothetical protein
VSADSSLSDPAPAPAAPPAAPVSERAAFVVLGTMLLLIVALTVLLVQSTWADARVATESTPAPQQATTGSIAQR